MSIHTDYKDIVLEETEREAHECVLRLLDKVVEWAEGVGNSPVLSEMLADQMYDDIYSVEPGELYKMYRYLLKLVLHLKANPDYSELNRLDVLDNGNIEIYAYDYKTFCWCLDNKMDKGLSNGIIVLYKDSTPKNVYNNLLKKIEEK